LPDQPLIAAVSADGLLSARGSVESMVAVADHRAIGRSPDRQPV